MPVFGIFVTLTIRNKRANSCHHTINTLIYKSLLKYKSK